MRNVRFSQRFIVPPHKGPEAVSAERWFGAYFLRIIDIAWSAYTSGGPMAMPTEAATDSQDDMVGDK